jgi:hypothetical protein
MNAHTLGIAFAFPGGDLRRQLALLVQPSLQALALHNANLCLCHVQPTPMFGGVMKLNFVQEASNLLRRKRFIQARAIMGIQIAEVTGDCASPKMHKSQFMADIEQVLREKKPFILRCMLDGIKKLQGRMGKWNRCALSVSITWA